MVTDKFNSSRTRMTNHERAILAPLLNAFPPDMMVDYHSLGQANGARHDRGDMEVVIPANTTRWGMDDQIHQFLAHKLIAAAEESGWPYELHTLEDLWQYYFGDRLIGNFPWAYMQEKVYLLNTQSPYDGYDSPSDDSEVEALESPAIERGVYELRLRPSVSEVALRGVRRRGESLVRDES